MPIPTNFNYTKTWLSSDDFPTYESDETKVRSDMQCLYDEIRDALNALAQAISAANVPFNPTAEIPDVSDVQAAIEAVQAQIAGVVLSQIPDGTITTAKLADGAVTGEKLADGAVSPDKVVDASIDSTKLALSSGCFVMPPFSLTAGVHYFDSVEDLEETLASAPVGTIAFVKVQE